MMTLIIVLVTQIAPVIQTLQIQKTAVVAAQIRQKAEVLPLHQVQIQNNFIIKCKYVNYVKNKNKAICSL